MRIQDLPKDKLKPGLKVKLGNQRGVITYVYDERYSTLYSAPKQVVSIRWTTAGDTNNCYYTMHNHDIEEDAPYKIIRLKCLRKK